MHNNKSVRSTPTVSKPNSAVQLIQVSLLQEFPLFTKLRNIETVQYTKTNNLQAQDP